MLFFGNGNVRWKELMFSGIASLTSYVLDQRFIDTHRPSNSDLRPLSFKTFPATFLEKPHLNFSAIQKMLVRTCTERPFYQSGIL